MKNLLSIRSLAPDGDPKGPPPPGGPHIVAPKPLPKPEDDEVEIEEIDLPEDEADEDDES